MTMSEVLESYGSKPRLSERFAGMTTNVAGSTRYENGDVVTLGAHSLERGVSCAPADLSRKRRNFRGRQVARLAEIRDRRFEPFVQFDSRLPR